VFSLADFGGSCWHVRRTMDLEPCTKDEFDAFIAAYPRELKRKNIMVSDPPLVTFNDATFGGWPESMVASYMGYPHNVPTRFRIAKKLPSGHAGVPAK
jgi:hypothetical protein